jgi:hypothetical protein
VYLRQVVARVLELQAAGVTVRGIAAVLSTEGCSTKRGCRWHATTVQRILDRHGHRHDT